MIINSRQHLIKLFEHIRIFESIIFWGHERKGVFYYEKIITGYFNDFS